MDLGVYFGNYGREGRGNAVVELGDCFAAVRGNEEWLVMVFGGEEGWEERLEGGGSCRGWVIKEGC